MSTVYYSLLQVAATGPQFSRKKQTKKNQLILFLSKLLIPEQPLGIMTLLLLVTGKTVIPLKTLNISTMNNCMHGNKTDWCIWRSKKEATAMQLQRVF